MFLVFLLLATKPRRSISSVHDQNATSNEWSIITTTMGCWWSSNINIQQPAQMSHSINVRVCLGTVSCCYNLNLRWKNVDEYKRNTWCMPEAKDKCYHFLISPQIPCEVWYVNRDELVEFAYSVNRHIFICHGIVLLFSSNWHIFISLPIICNSRNKETH